MKKILGLFVIALVLVILVSALQDVPEVRRFTDRAVRTISIAGLAILTAVVVFVVGHRLGASTERSHVSASPANTFPTTYQPAAPQILMLPPAQTSLPREVWERPLSSNQSVTEASAPRKVDWSVIS